MDSDQRHLFLSTEMITFPRYCKVIDTQKGLNQPYFLLPSGLSYIITRNTQSPTRQHNSIPSTTLSTGYSHLKTPKLHTPRKPWYTKLSNLLPLFQSSSLVSCNHCTYASCHEAATTPAYDSQVTKARYQLADKGWAKKRKGGGQSIHHTRPLAESTLL